MDATTLVFVFIGIAVALAAGWLVGRAAARSQLRADDLAAQTHRVEELTNLRATLADAKAEALRHAQETAQVKAEFAQFKADQVRELADAETAARMVAEAKASEQEARAQLAEVRAQVAGALAERDGARKRVEEMTADREQMVNQFKVLSSQTLKEQGKTADEQAQQRLERTRQVLEPVEKSLAALNERLQQVEKDRAAMSSRLAEQVNTVVMTNENLRRETAALTNALRKPQVRGAWGELQLKRVVELSGMVEHCDFVQQSSDVTSADQRIRPDLRVFLGDGKFIFVDSKVPLAAFLDAQEAGDHTQRAANLAQFASNVRSHVDQLSAKQYWKASSQSPEFVVLFIPSESLAAEALSQQPDLNEYAASKNVIIASPTTLIAMLRAVAYGWRQAALAESAQEVFELGRELYERLATLGGHFDKLGRALKSTVNVYNQTVGSLEHNVLVQARRFRDLQLTGEELGQLNGLEESTRTLSAPELLASAQEYAGSVDGSGGEAVNPSGSHEALTSKSGLDAIPASRPRLADLVDDAQSQVMPMHGLG